MENKKLHFKMYKAGRHWVVAGLIAATILGTNLLVDSNSAKAAVTESNSSTDQYNSTTKEALNKKEVTLAKPADKQDGVREVKVESNSQSSESSEVNTAKTSGKQPDQISSQDNNDTNKTPARLYENGTEGNDSIQNNASKASSNVSDSGQSPEGQIVKSETATVRKDETNKQQTNKTSVKGKTSLNARSAIITQQQAKLAKNFLQKTNSKRRQKLNRPNHQNKLAVTPTAANQADDDLVYDDAPIDEWMPNKALQQVLLDNLNRDSNLIDPYGPNHKTFNSVDDIKKSDLLLLKEVSLQTANFQSTYIDGKQSFSIEGLQYATNLTSLDLLNSLNGGPSGTGDGTKVIGYWHGDLTDLSPIKNLTKLTWLQFSNNRVSDVTPLKNLTNIKYLSAVNNCISDFSPIDANQYKDSSGNTPDLSIKGQDIFRDPVYVLKGQKQVTVNNLGAKLPKNYYNDNSMTYYDSPKLNINDDYWSWYSSTPSMQVNVYRKGATGVADGDSSVTYTIEKNQITPGPTSSSVVGSGIYIHQQPYTYYLVARYNDSEGKIPVSYYIPYITDAEEAADITVHYVDEDNQTISPDEKLPTRAVGQSYEVSPKDINGYTVDNSKLPTNATGKYGDTPINITYVYKKNPVETGSVTVKYVADTDLTKEIATSEVLTGKVGDSYTAEQKTISGYTFKAVQGNSTGTFTAQPQTVTYIYTKDNVVPPITETGKVIAKYVDEQGKSIASEETVTGKLGATYTTQQKNITGYKFKKVVGNPSGVFTKVDQMVTYVYAKKPSVAEGTVVYSLKPIYLYKNTTFNKQERQAYYGRKPRINRPMFVVQKVVNNQAGRQRYYVKDVNHHSATFGLKGYITTRWEYTRPVYYKTTSKNITIINPQGVNEYKQKDLTKKVKNLKQGTHLTVKKIVHHNLTTRYQLVNGHYITANRKLVIHGKYISLDGSKRKMPVTIKVTNKKGINLYRTGNFSKKTKVRHYKRGTVLKVKRFEYTKPYSRKHFGVKRYAVKGGYITAHAKFVKVTKTR